MHPLLFASLISLYQNFLLVVVVFSSIFRLLPCWFVFTIYSRIINHAPYIVRTPQNRIFLHLLSTSCCCNYTFSSLWLAHVPQPSLCQSTYTLGLLLPLHLITIIDSIHLMSCVFMWFSFLLSFSLNVGFLTNSMSNVLLCGLLGVCFFLLHRVLWLIIGLKKLLLSVFLFIYFLLPIKNKQAVIL